MARKTIKQRIALDGGKELQRELEQLGDKGAAAFKLLQEAANQVKGPSSAFLQSLEQASQKLDAFGRKFRDLGQQMRDVGSSFTAKVSLPIAGLGAGILKVAGDFESGLNRIQAVSSATGAEMEKVRELALQLGADTVFSGRQVEEGMESLLKNGLALEQVTGGAIQGVTKLAAATGSELAGAADVASDTMQSFRLGAEQFNTSVDQIVGTLTASKFGFDDYKLALGQAGGVLGALGVSFEDFNTVLAATSNLFSSGSDAGTSFKTFMTRLVPQSKDAAAAMKEYNLQFFDAQGNMRSMAEVAEELRTKLAGLSDEDLSKTLTDIFGVDALRTAVGLMRKGADGLRLVREEIAKGDAEAQATSRMQGFNGALEQLGGSLETLANRVADAGLLKWATDLVKGLDGLVDRFSKTNPATFKFGTVLAGVAAAIGPVIFGLGSLVAQVGFASIGFARILDLIRAVRVGLISMQGVMLASGWLAAVAVIGTGIALWASSTDAATKAMETHEGVVGRVEEAYRKAGFQVAKMAQDVRDRLLLETRAALEETSKQLAESLSAARTELTQWETDEAFAQPLLALAKRFSDSKISVEEFQAGVARLAATDPRLDWLASNMLRITDESAKLSGAVKEDADKVALLKGEMSDASFQARNFSEEQRAAAAAVSGAGEAAAQTTQKVEALGKTITVHSSDGDKVVKQTFSLVDGVAKAVDTSKKNLDDVGESADQAGKKIAKVKNDVSDLIIHVPDELKSQASPAETLTEGLDQVGPAVSSAVEGSKEGIASVGEAWKASGEAAAGAFAGASENTKIAVDGVIAEVSRVQPAVQAALAGGAVQQPGEEGQQQAAGIADALARPFEDGRDRIGVALQEVPIKLTVAVTAIQATIAEASAGLGEGLVTPFDTAATGIAQVLERMVSVVQSQFDAVLSAVQSAVAQLQSSVASLEALASRAEAAAARVRAANSDSGERRANGGPIGVLHRAGGGAVSGPGTSTSDSILSWLSNGEFVVRAAAVKKYGLDLLYALNGMRLPKKLLEGFAAGGAVDFSGVVSRLTDGMRMPRMMPALAEGGAVPAANGLRPLILDFGGERFETFAPEDVADRLAKHQGRKGLRKAGKKPGWR
ncbi:phage tail tape measure protein [Ensifer adhaerens]|uniref:phage tail tape measure protein n=1 Tax=Ensifer adhaerens TaxID=106592 RepID=UPI001CC026B0|nr:phage tail tape measure protein [Ensifer adhaerens]MBZ7921664.1 phage tail tape measure protein [Ensifer adhaerens]UAX94079.1 phage tail tape measure protein [Ensifer adhaerens]UAY01713.1 phage tail tape measure protein [Ensifer adhaerens]UAY09097.1 phage tail tape measure protein [Ensifer adhaerens]